MTNELDVLKKLHYGTFPESELLEIYHQYRNKYRICLKLLQQPNFPERDAFNIIPTLYPMDLIRVIKNKRTKSGIRKRAEMEFVNKSNKYPLGEKLSYMKVAPHTLLAYFIEENDNRVLTAMLKNPYMTEDLILRFINRKTGRHRFYEALAETEWYKRPQVALAISLDNAAPIKMVIMCIPFLSLVQLEDLYQNENTHMIIKNNIIQYLNNRRSTDSGNDEKLI